MEQQTMKRSSNWLFEGKCEEGQVVVVASLKLTQTKYLSVAWPNTTTLSSYLYI